MLVYTWSGAYNIAATQPHWRTTLFFIDLLKERSIEVRSSGKRMPELVDANMDDAYSHFHEMCRLCHGAPGYDSLGFAGGLYPSPPSLVSGDLQRELGEAEIYWVVKHGIKMTGMPAFGPAHDEKELLGLAALVEEIPRLTPEQYRRRVGAPASKDETSHGHHHQSEGENNHGHGPDEASNHGEAKEDHN
jgi:hypothetical protein